MSTLNATATERNLASTAPRASWLDRLLATDADPRSTIARVVLGAVMLPHGAQKMLGWFGGYGFSATVGTFHDKMGIPVAFAALAVFAEFFGALGLLVGALSRVAALGVAAVMAVAIVMVHAHFGFFMNWFGQQAGEGFEYHLLALGLAVIVMWKGAGAASFDRWLTSRKAAR